MKALDVVLLTADKYLPSEELNPLARNVILENKLAGDALEKQGLKVATKSWSDATFDWSTTSFVMVRTPWDYFERFAEFMNWFTATSKKTNFINSHNLINWNIDKNYLKELQGRGVHLPNTFFISKGAQISLNGAMKNAEEQFGKSVGTWVLKPCIAGGAYNTYKLDKTETEAYEERFRQLIQDDDFMLQEFQWNIVEKGEISLMLFQGQYSHAVIKNAKPGDFRVQDDYGGSVALYEASEQEIAFSKHVLKACTELPLYARVDIFEDNSGELALAELEIFEPELWFRLYPEAADLQAKAVKDRYFQ
ncbi:MAG: hypothetical protein ED555_11055 [Allomuricauda sp.]|nr:MAG: hypothetical protein ED555_11055 [Allomuricauda sp.]